MHKSVRLYAYVNCNLGDDLFVRSIADRYPDVRFYLHKDSKVTDAFYDKKNITVYSEDPWYIRMAGKIRPSFAAGIKNLQEKYCSALVYVGGSLFIEYKNWETILTWWRYKAEQCTFFVLGANFGPWHTDEYHRQMGEIFEKMQDVCFRDLYSKELFADIPVVRYAPDILLGYPMQSVAVKPGQAFISVINCSSKDEGDNKLKVFDKSYVKTTANLTNCLLDRGWKVVLSSFCRAEGDEEGIEKVLQNLKDPSSAEVVKYNGTNAEEVLNRLAESEIIYGTRFHAVILGFAAGRPVIPIIYSDKTRRVLEDMDYSGTVFDIRELNEDAGRQMADIAQDYKAQYLQNADGFAKQSEKHFEKLDLLIG